MPKKRKKKNQKSLSYGDVRTAAQTKLTDRLRERLTPPNDLTPEAKAEAIGRLKTLFTALTAPVEGVLDILNRAEIPYALNTSPDGTEFYAITKKDLEAGEQRLKEQGPLAKRIYGDKVMTQMPMGQPLSKIEEVNEIIDLNDNNLYGQTPEQVEAINTFIERGE